MNSMKKPFRYDLNQIPYDYTVEVTNRFKGLDLLDIVPEELWTELPDIVQEAEIKTIPKEKKCKKGKMVVWGGLKNSCEKRSERQRRKGKIYPFECRVPKIARRDKPSSVISVNTKRKTIEWERLEIFSRK